jgi:ribulose-phosphate 3-epimerase
MAEIIPAIIPKSLEDLRDHLDMVVGYVPMVQVDVTDGRLVPTKSWPYFGAGYDDYFQNILSEQEGLPYWDKVDFEIDLMVNDQEKAVRDWITAGAKRIVLHLESPVDVKDILRRLNKEFDSVKNSLLGIEIGVAVNLNTPNEKIYELLDELDQNGMPLADFIQFMGIRNIGYQGQVFDGEVIDKISDLHEKYPDTIISVDGGVSEQNAEKILHAGATRLICGSAIFESDNPLETIEYFRKL